MIIPFVMTEPVIFHCLAVAPTLVLAIVFAVLYLVDQVHDLAEQLYLILQIFFNLLAFMIVVVYSSPSGTLYGLFYCHLLIALSIDLFLVVKERGFALLGND